MDYIKTNGMIKKNNTILWSYVIVLLMIKKINNRAGLLPITKLKLLYLGTYLSVSNLS